MTVLYQNLSLAFRVAVLLFGMALGVFALVASAAIADAATLKSEAVLTAPVLTAGDLFEGLDQDKASRTLGPAPQPGQDMILNALTLMRVAAALDIEWKPQSTADQITVRTAGTVIDEQIMRDAVSKKLQEKGINGHFAVSFLNAPKMVLPQGAAPTAEVASIAYHPESDRFEATLAAPSAAHAQSKVEITGHVERIVSVPMLKKGMRNGDIVRAEDVDWVELPSKNLQSDAIIDADQMIGKTPRRMVMADQAVRIDDLIEPLMVSRGQSVTIMYEKGPITVTAKGKALEDGARGSSIRVVNVVSERSIDATVRDSGLVTVAD